MEQFESLGLKSGIWQGLLRRDTAPARIVLVHLGARLAEARVTAQEDGLWRVAVGIPSQKLSDGLQSFLLLEDEGKEGDPVAPDAAHLGSMNIVAGKPLDEDLLAELNLMRNELDLLKREFRRLAAARD
ncbi:hypothetical protein [Paracoccus ravus]|uniref:hypothetical protein n=1 Tax=Paracoccus ravus TaxID=2447760 RepID=UPI00106DDC4E|nr:hypothetical protein [Paracoccus ravus]